MPNKDKILDETVSRFERIVNKIYAMERIPKDFGTGELLHLGQVNTIVAVGNNPRINITQLSDELGVTKGTVSEMVKKLEEKGYLRRIRPPDNGKTVWLDLTPKGESVCKRHEKSHRENLSGFFEDITFGQAAIFNEILAKIEAFADNKAKKGK